jgi:hypothetical protein
MMSPLRESSATTKLGPDPWLPSCATEAKRTSPSRFSADTCPPSENPCATLPEARSSR